MHPVDLLGSVQSGLVSRLGIEASEIDQVIGGCVSQIGEQSFNVARTAWLGAGLPIEVPATTVDSQCGSSQQASTLAAGLVSSGLEYVVMSCGVECMTRVPLGWLQRRRDRILGWARRLDRHLAAAVGGRRRSRLLP